MTVAAVRSLSMLMAASLIATADAAQKKTAKDGFWAVFIACSALAVVFILALWCIRGLEWAHTKITGKEEDKDE